MTNTRKSFEEGGIENPSFEHQEEDGAGVSKHQTSSVNLTEESRIVIESEEKEVERTNWDNPIEFLLSCISMSVGLGNIWRFPAVALNNGGGAFVIPYIIVLLIIGRPIYFLEMSLGQFASYGSVNIWSLSPFFKGLGVMGLFAGICLVSYYCSIIAMSVRYFAASFAKDLPWSYCWDSWDDCIDCQVSNCPQMYFEREITKIVPSLDDGLGGWPNWQLALCLLFTWAFIFFSLIRGVQSSGKVAYFTAIFPYVVLFTFLIRGVTLEGAGNGVSYFLTPQWEKILEPGVWYEAVAQCFFSLGTGTGALTMFASYNPFKHPCYRDALVVSMMDTATSLLAGVTIFSVLGHLAFISNTEMEDLQIGGPSLVFISYPSAIANFDWVPQLFAVLFFLMLFTLGIGSAIPLVSIPLTAIEDAFPKLKRVWLVLGASLTGFGIGLLYVTPGGQYLVDLVDYYGAGFMIYLICLIQSAAIAWFYGLDNICQDIYFMTGVRLGYYWKICWGFIIPVGLTGILVYKFTTEKELISNGVPFPSEAHIAGWIIVGAALSFLVFFAIKAVLGAKGGGIERVKNAIAPSKEWGPRAPSDKRGWEIFKKQTEFVSRILVNEKEVGIFKVRGMKEDIQVVQKDDTISATLYNISEGATVDYSSQPNGVWQKFQLWINKQECNSWTITEKKAQTFVVRVVTRKGFLKKVDHDHQRAGKMLTATIKF